MDLSRYRHEGLIEIDPIQLGRTGTNDLLVSNSARTNESQVWFIAEHVLDEPLVRAE
jgi:hypothetical protein